MLQRQLFRTVSLTLSSRTFTAAAALFFLAVVTVITARPAHAQRYVSLGVGGVSLDERLATFFDDSEANAIRATLGQRFGPLALEASIIGTEFAGGSTVTGRGDYSTIAVAVDLKYHLGLLGPLEGYAKLGLNKSWLRSPTDRPTDHSGTGYNVGAGIQWNLRIGLTTAALWLEYTHLEAELRSPKTTRNFDGSFGLTLAGVSLGF